MKEVKSNELEVLDERIKYCTDALLACSSAKEFKMAERYFDMRTELNSQRNNILKNKAVV